LSGAKNTREEPLLKVPKKLELPKDKSIDKKEEIVYRQDQQIVNDCGPYRHRLRIKQVSKYRTLQKQDGKSRTSKHNEYDDDL
jgi:hypothetical protein